jgi:hypothetical protein
MGRLLSALAVLALSARVAYADSDGAYCTGPDYLAVELRSFNTPGLGGDHVLKVARFDVAGGPRWTGEVVLDDFQTHRVTCGHDSVTIEGWRIGFVSYVVTLDANRVPRIHARSADPGRKFLFLGADPANLGNWAAPGVTRISAPGATHAFQVRVTRTSQSEPGGIRHETTSTLEELEELDRSGRVIRSLRLYSGTRHETVH